jgi:hypothetical protein
MHYHAKIYAFFLLNVFFAMALKADENGLGPVNLELRHPQDGGIYVQKDGRSWVRFYWRFNTGEPEPVLLEISPSRKFNEVIKEKVLDHPPYVWMNRLTGRYYWRLSSLNEKGEIIETTPIWEYMISPPAPDIEGKDHKNIKFSSNNPELDFVWNDKKNDSIVFYRFKFSSDKKFENPIVIKETSENRIRLKDIPEGQYYWKVGVKHSKYLPIQYSKTYLITMKKTDEVIKPAILFAPKDGETLRIFGEDGTIRLTWGAVDNAIVYKIEVAKEDEFSEAESQVLPENSTDIIVRPGTYYWRVKAVNPRGEESTWSEVSVFQVKEYKNDIAIEFPGDDDEISDFQIEFDWESLSDCDNYELVIAYTRDLKKTIHRKSVSTPKVTIELDDEGQYFWQVVCDSGADKGIKSSISAFKIKINR